MTIQTVESHLNQRPRSLSDPVLTDKAILLAVAACLAIALVTLGMLAQPGSDPGSQPGAYETVAMVGL